MRSRQPRLLLTQGMASEADVDGALTVRRRATTRKDVSWAFWNLYRTGRPGQTLVCDKRHRASLLLETRSTLRILGMRSWQTMPFLKRIKEPRALPKKYGVDELLPHQQRAFQVATSGLDTKSIEGRTDIVRSLKDGPPRP